MPHGSQALQLTAPQGLQAFETGAQGLQPEEYTIWGSTIGIGDDAIGAEFPLPDCVGTREPLRVQQLEAEPQPELIMEARRSIDRNSETFFILYSKRI